MASALTSSPAPSPPTPVDRQSITPLEDTIGSNIPEINDSTSPTSFIRLNDGSPTIAAGSPINIINQDTMDIDELGGNQLKLADEQTAMDLMEASKKRERDDECNAQDDDDEDSHVQKKSKSSDGRTLWAFKAGFCPPNEARIEWRGTTKERAEAAVMYEEFKLMKHVLKKSYKDTPSPSLYRKAGRYGIILWGRAKDPYAIPELELPAQFRESLRTVQDLLPESACTSVQLTEHVLTTSHDLAKCDSCKGRPRRTTKGKAVVKKTQTKKKATRAAANQQKAKPRKPQAPPPTYIITGNYSDSVGLTAEPDEIDNGGGLGEWVLDCGCNFTMAIWGFFAWKNLWGQNSETGEWERMFPIPVHPREFVFQNLSNFAGLKVGNLMNPRGTGFWDRRFHLHLRKTQLEYFQRVVNELEELEDFEDEDYPGWPNVPSRIAAVDVVPLKRVPIKKVITKGTANDEDTDTEEEFAETDTEYEEEEAM
ncbi:hypothetical protein BDN72DRAFT_863541 [Pluteus cervinus]|uniref:Uncharacterized protein n=1 Tax=Pluteus cervinus TaxID=181527 RepID=A0ACD3A780_9AGAR|nr:hypothetical protein BDN72DRAFT_863541 [Pluteus cervinus]